MSAAKHEPMRQCRVCRRRRLQTELVRMGIPGKEGRGAYACSDSERCSDILPRTLGSKTSS